MEFLFAVAKNDLQQARHFIQSGHDVNSPITWNAKDTYSPVIPPGVAANPELMEKLQSNQEYQTRPLNIAVLGGHADMVRLLLSAGADINMKDGRGRTALVCAIYGLDLDASNINTSNLHLIAQTHERHFDIMKNILLRHPNLYVSTLDASQYEIKGITPLCLASYLGKAEIIQLLLDDGRVNVDGTDSKNATALMYAARDGNLPIVKMLLYYMASPDLTDNHGWSAIQYAERSPEIVQACEEALRKRRCDLSSLHTSLPLKKFPLHYSKLSTLIGTVPPHPSSLSHIQFEVLKQVELMDPNASSYIEILQQGFVQAIKVHDHTALQTMLLWSPQLRPDDRPSAGPLLVNHHDPKTGLTALHHAMRTKPLPSLDTIAMLYQAGADINAQTFYGRTALHHLARFGVDKDGRTWGIQKSAKAENAKKGSNRQRMNSSSPTASPPMEPRIVEEEHSMTLNPSSAHRFSMQSTVSARSYVSEHSGSMSPSEPTQRQIVKDLVGMSSVPQHLAMCASLLIRLGALVNIVDPTGNTPLHFASEFGGVPEVLSVLILEGQADLTIKNKKGLTPLDVCKSEEVRDCILGLEKERKISNKMKSLTSFASNNIKSLDLPSDDRTIMRRSPSQSTMQSSVADSKSKKNLGLTVEAFSSSVSEAAAARRVQIKRDTYEQVDADFEKILKAFYNYQTNFTTSIETALAYMTDTIKGSWSPENSNQTGTPESLHNTMIRLRYELREAHEMFDETDQRTESVMLRYREELEQVEQVYQADWEMSELQRDKVEKLFDVLERIEGRFCQLELDQEELVHQTEQLRKAVSRHIDTIQTDGIQDDVEFWTAVSNLNQSLLIVETVPMDPILYQREDRNRLCQDMRVAVEQMLATIQQRCQRGHDPSLDTTRRQIESRWNTVRELLSKPAADVVVKEKSLTVASPLSAVSRSVRVPYWKQQLHTVQIYRHGSQPPSMREVPRGSLNELELSFEILNANLQEIQKDLDEIHVMTEEILAEKKQMYETCLTLENELMALETGNTHLMGTGKNDVDTQTHGAQHGNQNRSPRTKDIVSAELQAVMQHTQKLFDRQAELDKERQQLRKELLAVENQLDGTRQELRQVRPPLLLQGLLERLEIDEGPFVRIEKDWKEDADLVTEVIETEDETDCSSSASESSLVANLERCTSRVSARCWMIRLDASLYCLKVLGSYHIGRSRQSLLETQAFLGQANSELEETRSQMLALFNDAAEVSPQVFALKTELETIVKHRKEEVIKVWEVVDEVSEGIDSNLMQAGQSQLEAGQNPPPLPPQADLKQDPSEESDRHQWIVKELEQLQNVHGQLQEAIEELKRDQADIGAHLRQLGSNLIEPQVDKLVGQDHVSLLSISDQLTDLMERIRERDLGAVAVSKPSSMQQSNFRSGANTGSSRISMASSTAKRLSTISNRSAATRSIVDNRRISMALSIRTDKKRLSMMSISSLSSLSTYHQERMLARASTLSNALSRTSLSGKSPLATKNGRHA
ncbi:uncharacterized protein BYT42DRAFT_640825 [Radiomyces spectabilis]|uniref:uncharacterized protein n=1 Tax=Radiomyces spectabilis TaxID=64574 RepID=UPI00221E777F|nr:uncharacterized protein BYT42DRAFT_640825 [Radiomyces spectabilis]KAI8393691.1 hypothetical protein BYT42DRAFT_640825 [Radiomyces spectabilis]